MISINQNCHNFIYGRQNKLARKYQTHWQEGKDFGIYFITGRSGNGKTTFLRSLFEPEKVRWYTKREIEQMIVDGINDEDKLQGAETAIAFIEFLDDVFVSDYSISLVKKMLQRWEYDQDGEKRLILCTFVDERNAKRMGGYPVIKINPVKICKSVVIAKAQELCIDISHEQLCNLSEMESMIEVVSILKTIEAYR